MIPYKSRTGRMIRSLLGGVIGAGAAFLLITHSQADEAPAPVPAYVTGSELAAACDGHDGWADPAPPARIFGNTWYVGTCGITALLVTSDDGHVLFDGGPGEAAPLIAANIERIGFKLSDVRWIASSHEHYDHVGGLAELKRLTGAQLAALAPAAAVLAAGKSDATDPQRVSAKDFAPVATDRVLEDGDQLNLGPLHFTVRATPAHSPGSASWSWQSCESAVCRTITYADSTSIISDDDYRYSDHPDRVEQARMGLARIKALPCEVLVTPHPGASNLFARLAGEAPLFDPQACRAHAERGEKQLAERLVRETPFIP